MKRGTGSQRSGRGGKSSSTRATPKQGRGSASRGSSTDRKQSDRD